MTGVIIGKKKREHLPKHGGRGLASPGMSLRLIHSSPSPSSPYHPPLHSGHTGLSILLTSPPFASLPLSCCRAVDLPGLPLPLLLSQLLFLSLLCSSQLKLSLCVCMYETVSLTDSSTRICRVCLIHFWIPNSWHSLAHGMGGLDEGLNT